MNIFEKIKKLVEEGKTEEAEKLLADHMADEVKGLKTKNDELLGKLKEQKSDQDKLSERLEAIEKEKEEAEHKALEKSGDIEKIKASLEEKHKKELDALKETNTGLEAKLHKHVVGEGLTAALSKAGVQAPLMDAARALIESKFKAEIGDNDGTPFAKFDGKAVDEFITEWAGSDTGKHFVSAKSNSGGGSNGANDGGKAPSGKQMTRSEFDNLGAVEQSKFSIEGGRLVDG